MNWHNSEQIIVAANMHLQFSFHPFLKFLSRRHKVKLPVVKGGLNHYTTGEYIPQRSYISDEVYSLMLDNIVPTCVDVLLYSSDGTVLLGKREPEPHPDWWVTAGGRMMTGESLEDTARRKLKEELSLDASGLDFFFVTFYSVAWSTRNQQPQDRGCHMFGILLAARAPKNVTQEIHRNKEYSKHRFVAIDEILTGDFHPCLKQMARELKKQLRWWRRLFGWL